MITTVQDQCRCDRQVYLNPAVDGFQPDQVDSNLLLPQHSHKKLDYYALINHGPAMERSNRCTDGQIEGATITGGVGC